MTPVDQDRDRVVAAQARVRLAPATSTDLVAEASEQFLGRCPEQPAGERWPESAIAVGAATILAQRLLDTYAECLRISNGNHGQVGDLEWLLERWQSGRLSEGDYIDAVREVFSLLQDHVSQLRAVVK